MRFLLYKKNETLSPVQKNLHIAFAKKLSGPYSPAAPAITGNYWAEGPTAIKLKDEWIVYLINIHSINSVK